MAHTHDVYDMENHFEINGSSRFIKETSETKLVVVQGDHKSEVLTFKMPRYIDGHDMTLCNKIRIHYINLDTKTNNKSADVYEVTDLTLCEECEDVLTFTWTIEAPATKYSGTLSFLVKFECTEGENVLYQWNTAKYVSVNVLAGIDNSEEFVEKYSNVLEEWYNELTKGADSIEELNQQAIAEIELAKEDAKEDIQGKANSTMAAVTKHANDTYSEFNDDVDNKMASMTKHASDTYTEFESDVNQKVAAALKSIPEEYSALDAEVKEQGDALAELVGNEVNITDLSKYEQGQGFIETTNVWAYVGANNIHVIIPITETGCTLSITAHDTIDTIYAGLKSYTTPIDLRIPDFSEVWNTRRRIACGFSVSEVIPDDVKFICVVVKNNARDATPVSFSITKEATRGKIPAIEKEIKELKESKEFGYSVIDFENLYSIDNNTGGYWINSGGNIAVDDNSFYASVPVESDKDIYLCYGIDKILNNANFSSIRFANESTKISHITDIQNYVIDKKYHGFDVAKLTVPQGASCVEFSVKIGIAGIDARETMIVSYTDLSEVVDDEEVSVNRIGEYQIRDNVARKQIEEINKRKYWSGKKWACVGDSLTDQSTGYTAHYYYDYIAEHTGIEVVNMGVRGTGYAKKEAGQDNAFYHRILNVPTDTDVVTIFGSFNDFSSGLPLGEIDDTELTTMAGYINATLDRLYSIIPLAKVGIITPTPWSLFNSYNSTGVEKENTEKYVGLLIGICQKRSIPYLDLYRESNLRPWDATFRELAFHNADGTHPNEAGHAIIAPKFLEFIKRLLMY